MNDLAAGIKSIAADILNGTADLVWPPHCCICGSFQGFFCDDCRETIQLILSPYCSTCGYPVQGSNCPCCGDSPWQRRASYKAMRQIALYEGTLAEAIRLFKFEGMRCLAVPLASLLTDWLETAPDRYREAHFVTSVPCSLSRKLRLGYHHAGVLAGRTAAHLGLPVINPVRRISSRHQVGLTYDERLKNASKLFAPVKRQVDIEGRTVLLIDDIVTTGATAEAVSRVLKQLGAREVLVLAIARTP